MTDKPPDNNLPDTFEVSLGTSGYPTGEDSLTSSSPGNESGQSTPADGEYLLLLESLLDESPPLTENLEAALQKELIGTNGLCENELHASTYGHPLPVEVAAKKMPAGPEGMIWYATIIPDNFFIDGKLSKKLNPRDFDEASETIKPRRPTLPVTQNDFFSSITKVCEAGQLRPRFVFSGVLNGWPSLNCFELLALEKKRSASSLPSPKDLMVGNLLWTSMWHTDTVSSLGMAPQSFLDSKKVYRAKLRGAPWTEYGWSEESEGFAFWFEAMNSLKPKVVYGTDMVRSLSDRDAKCTRIHMISHRYAKERESPRDRLTYHSICLLEWDHGRYCTVTEAAYLNGIGGYRGRSNWYEDRDAPISSLYNAFPPEMICPWKTTSAEIRCYDVESKSLDEFKQYMKQFEGNKKRFVDINYSFSHPARITFRSKSDIAQYLINYIMRDKDYAELRRNCQTYTADLCAFIAGKKNVQPFHPVSRMDYQNRTHFFLYDYKMYQEKKNFRQKSVVS